jgi:diphthamide synthase (EF-2-diphthine--ammonia ligase)
VTHDDSRGVVSWSGGKDSCLALAEIRRTHDVAALLTTITRDFDRISMHGVRFWPSSE